MIVLGNKNAAVSSLGIQIEGQLAYIARRLIYLHRLPTQKKQLIIGTNFILKSLLRIFSH
jgi:NADH dehydrogenase